ncbi:MAG TPA: glutamate formimidoyltransferase [Chitinophagales bacterium]|jgi:glutamate formiminotransferase/formiminotetrahydrofolate cyclodeaminase|nr:glutamate formimidoyltransferase [Chitinophagales bacterium]HQV77541.1 glutamate formimidoyltransferase [Chitinophagales bacterium]HQW79634.1 glutamate formimidoyltransferase [Chitinophagales bacterium]HRB67869.1 glutamate formimidoyltransferase [Chitinophagales bacterium]
MFSATDSLIECVPNFSEGRNKQTIDAIAQSIIKTKDVKLLHIDIGFDANRTVFTFVGKPNAVADAAFNAICVAQQLIDMRMHKGAHPRMGACDVCPLIPFQNCTMNEAIELSYKLGKRIGNIGIPVYLYEQSAQNNFRNKLADIRKGEYEAIPEKLKDGNWKPDFGESVFNEKFGMMALGARNFLIAFNINLVTKDIAIAKAIAKKIRTIRNLNNESYLSILFQHVRAIGWYMDTYQCAQISTNIVDIHKSPIIDVFKAIQQIANDFGTSTNGSELVGLIPLNALQHSTYSIDEAIEYLGLNSIKPFDKEMNIIEYLLFK